MQTMQTMQTIQTMKGYVKIKSPDCSIAHSCYDHFIPCDASKIERERENYKSTRNWTRFSFTFKIYLCHNSGIFFHWLNDFIDDIFVEPHDWMSEVACIAKLGSLWGGFSQNFAIHQKSFLKLVNASPFNL